MFDADTTITALGHPGPVEVKMRTEGCELVLYFKDLSGEGDVLKIEINPSGGPLEPAAVRRIGSGFPLYVQYARACLQWDRDDVRATILALRSLGATKRGLPDDLYRRIATEYRAMGNAGEAYPIKALAERHWVKPSTASRWVKGARERGFIPENGGKE